MNYNCNERIKYNPKFYEEPLEEKMEIIQMFNKYHYIDKIENDKFITQIYNKKPKSFKDFQSNYYLYNDFFNYMFTTTNSLDFRIKIKKFTSEKMVITILTPFSQADATLSCNIKFDRSHQFNDYPNLAFYRRIKRINMKLLINSDANPYDIIVESIDDLENSLNYIIDEINNWINYYMDLNFNSKYAKNGYLCEEVS